MNTLKLITKLKQLNEHEYIKINGTERERLIFKNKDETFKIFGHRGVLDPFDDYSYSWLNDFLNALITHLERGNDLNTFEDNLHEYIDSTVNIYTSDLTEWLHDKNNNISYLTEALSENDKIDGFKALQIAQYKAIEELFYNALAIIKKMPEAEEE